MTTEVAMLNSANFAEMAKAMGMANEVKSGPAKQSTLPRLRIWNQPVMGQVEVKGKMKNMEVVPAGMYRIQLDNDRFVYAPDVSIRVFAQRFMYKRYDSANKLYIKTLMADDTNIDLKDNVGTLNCGKPAGYFKDYDALPQATRDLIKQTKRTRVIFGEVRMNNPVDVEGNEIESEQVYPFIWEIDNKDAFKTMGTPFQILAKQRRLPLQHWINCGTLEQSIQTGGKYYLPTAEINMTESIDLSDDDQTKFANFIEWINNYNDYILKTWNEKRKAPDEDEDFISVSGDDGFIDVETGDEE